MAMKKWIVADPDHLGGSPRVRGTRISLALILESLAAGMSVAEIVDAYPSLTVFISLRRVKRARAAEGSAIGVRGASIPQQVDVA
jgi:hypothetical protein